MSKPVLDNNIGFQNIYGQIARHDGFLNQGVRNDDSPTFANLYLNGDATVAGNLYVEGNTTLLNTNVIEFEDNILLLNRLETGDGVTLNQSGIEINRGALENYRIVYNESDSTFRAGLISDLRAVTFREDTPMDNGILIWNDSESRIDATDTIKIDITFSSSTNSENASSGAVVIDGGLGVGQDMFLHGGFTFEGTTTQGNTTIWADENFNISTSEKVYLDASEINIPYDTPLVFGDGGAERIVVEGGSHDTSIFTSGDLDLNLDFGKKINVPNQVPITFSTQNEKIFTDGSNNMVITGSEDIHLTPGLTKQVLVPVDTPISFYDENQSISANLSGDLFINSGNNINVTPGVNQNVCIPYNNGIKFGNTGEQLIYANESNELYVKSTSDLKLHSETNVCIPQNVPLTFGSSFLENIYSTETGDLFVSASGTIIFTGSQITSTEESDSIVAGALVVAGGAGIGKNLNVGGDVSINGNLTVAGTATYIDTINMSVADNLIIVNSAPSGLSDGGFLVKRYNPEENVFASVVFKESLNAFVFGESVSDVTDTSGSLHLSNYIDIHAKSLQLFNFGGDALILDGDSQLRGNVVINENLTVGSIITSELSVMSFIDTLGITTGSVNVSDQITIDSTNGVSILSNGGASFGGGFSVDGIVNFNHTQPSVSATDAAVVIEGGISIRSQENSSSIYNGGALTVRGGVAIGGDVWVGGTINGSSSSTTFAYLTLTATEESVNLTTGSLVTFGGITIQCETNSASATNGGSFTVAGGASIGLDMYIGNDIIINRDSYVNGHTYITGDLTFLQTCTFTSIANTTGSNRWTYFGTINNGTSNELQMYTNGVGVNLNVTLNDLSLFASHSKTTQSFENDSPNFYVYKDASDPDNISYHLYAELPPNSTSFVRILSNNPFDLSNVDGPNESYEFEYSTVQNETTVHLLGDTTVQKLRARGPLALVGYNQTSSATSIGTLYQRFQLSNDEGNGDIVNEQSDEMFILPDQSTANEFQVKLGNVASNEDDFYTGWWIRVNDYVRKVVSYNGAQRVVEIETSIPAGSVVSGDEISLYKKSFVVSAFDEDSNKFKLAFATQPIDNQVNYQGDVGLEVLNLTISDTSPSSISTVGGIEIASTSEWSLSTLGGVNAERSIHTDTGVRIGNNESLGDVQASLIVTQERSSIWLQNDNDVSFINFCGTSDNYFGITTSPDGNSFSFTSNTSGNTPDLSAPALTISTDGYIGINTTSIGTECTLKSGSFISVDDNFGVLGIVGGTSSSDVPRLSFNEFTTGDIEVSTGTSGSFRINTNENVFEATPDGIILLQASQPSKSDTSGSLIISGGVAIACTENSEDNNNGGALTVSGGVAVLKDIYIGGNLFVNGNISTDGSSESPEITFSNEINCSVISYGNASLMKLSNEAIFSFYVWVTPDVESENCQLEFSLPNRTNAFENRTELICACSGYTDDENVIPLFNVIALAQIETTRGMLKFQSVSTAPHYITIFARYSQG